MTDRELEERARHEFEEGRYMDMLRKLRIEADLDPDELMLAVYQRTREAGFDEAHRHRQPLPTCPICHCNMSGDREVPNEPSEACETGDWHDCRCHDGWQG
jgi:hypothetical protein